VCRLITYTQEIPGAKKRDFQIRKKRMEKFSILPLKEPKRFEREITFITTHN
jgi:hypothetical protein